MRARFAGFSYFDGAAAFCVDATFEPAAQGEKQFNMAAFNGRTIAFRKYGVFRFQLGGAARRAPLISGWTSPPRNAIGC